MLTNAETWVNIDDKSIKILENLQNFMFRCLLSAPKSTPACFLLWDLGSLTMCNRIIETKLNFLYHLLNLSKESLANEIISVQLKAGFPGLAKECKGYIQDLRLTDITEESISNQKWKNEVKQAILEKNKNDLIFEMKKKEKVKEYINEPFEKKEYFQSLNLHEARIIFKKRAKMLQFVKMNFPSDPVYKSELWQCSGCMSKIDTMSHVLWCSAYSNLRENKDINSDKDLASYLEQVLKIRSKLDILK